MREILFRGKRLHSDNEWAYGSLIVGGEGSTSIWSNDLADDVEVDPSTVGQYTGMTDKNGVKIFEGDIISIPGSKKQGLPAEVYYFHMGGFFGLRRYGYSEIRLEDSNEWAVIVGNIHDNPELLK